MDYESADSRSKGAWDPAPILKPFYEKWSSAVATPDFEIDEVWRGMVATLGFGGGVTAETVDWWKTTLKEVYKGDEGRRKVRMAVICLLERDGLLLRLGDIKCPFYWLQVSELFVNWSAADLAVIGFRGYIWFDTPRRTNQIIYLLEGGQVHRHSGWCALLECNQSS